MPDKSKRELKRELEELQASTSRDIEIASSSVVTLTSDGPEEPDVPPNATVVPTQSPVVTWYELPPDDDTDR